MSDKPDEKTIEQDDLLDEWWENKLKEYENKSAEQSQQQREQRRQAFRGARKRGARIGSGKRSMTRQSFDFERS